MALMLGRLPTTHLAPKAVTRLGCESTFWQAMSISNFGYLTMSALLKQRKIHTMKRLILASIIALLLGVAHGQDQQVPSEAECKVDKAVWSADAMSVSGIQALAAGEMKARELLRRSLEMSQCTVAYGKVGDKYSLISRAYSTAYETRVSNFLARHRDYWQVFVDEDTAGQR